MCAFLKTKKVNILKFHNFIFYYFYCHFKTFLSLSSNDNEERKNWQVFDSLWARQT